MTVDQVLTVPEVARRLNRNPETVRRWIREGRLPARKIGTQHLVEEDDLARVVKLTGQRLPLPDAWARTRSGAPRPDVVAAGLDRFGEGITRRWCSNR